MVDFQCENCFSNLFPRESKKFRVPTLHLTRNHNLKFKIKWVQSISSPQMNNSNLKNHHKISRNITTNLRPRPPPAFQMFLYMCRITAWFCERVYLYLIKCLLKIFGIKWRIQDKPKIIDQISGKCFVLHFWQTIDYDWAWYIISIYWYIMIYHNISL